MELLYSKKLRKRYENEEQPKLPKTSLMVANTLKISIPAAIETLFMGIIGMADTMMVGTYSTTALAAVSIAQQPVMITFAASFGLNAGIIAIVSRRRGENKRNEANASFKQGLILGVIAAIIMTILAIAFGEDLLKFAGAQADTIIEAKEYFRIVSTILVLNYLRMGITSAQRASGKTTISLVVNVVANVVNVFFNWCFIHGNLGFQEMGVKGAAYATVIGNGTGFLIAFLSVYRSKGFVSIKIIDDWRINKHLTKDLLRVSSGAFLEQLFMRVGFFTIAKIVNELGTAASAQNAIIGNIMSLSFNVADGFAVGASALVGRSLGEKDPTKAFAYGRISQIISLILSFFMIAIVVVLRVPLAYAFNHDPAIVEPASKYLVYTSIIFIPQSVQWVTTGILRGAGDTHYTARSSMISVMIVRPIAAYIFCYPLGLGLIGSYIGMFIDQSLRAVLNNTRFINLKWIKIDV